MKTQRRALLAIVFIVGAATVIAGTTAVHAHEDGKVELYVAELAVVAGDVDHNLDALVVDRDSGVAAPGFAVEVTGSGGGATLEPVELTSTSAGHYVGSVALSPGQWNLTIHADQGASAVPAKASTRTFAVTVAADGSAAVDGGDGGPAVWLLAALAAVAVLVAGGGVALWRRQRRQP